MYICRKGLRHLNPSQSHTSFFMQARTNSWMSGGSVQMQMLTLFWKVKVRVYPCLPLAQLMKFPQTNDNNKIWTLFSPLSQRRENRVSSGKEHLRALLSDTSSSDKESGNVHRYDGPNLELITPRGVKLTSVWWVPHLSLPSSGHLQSNHTTTPYLTSKTPAASRIILPPRSPNPTQPADRMRPLSVGHSSGNI